MNFTPSNYTISIIIPVYNGGDSFRRCLESIAKTSATPLETIVVADGDTDGSSELAEKYHNVKVIRLPQSKGPATARNRGAKEAKGDILLFIDADVEISPQTITQVSLVFQENPNIAALIGSYDETPGSQNFLSQYKNLFHHYTHQQGSEEATTFWGACGAIRREIFEKIGGFDESYRRPSVEDIELGYRLKKAGYQIKLCKHIQVKHLKRWEAISLLRAEFFYRALPWTALILNRRQMANDLNLNWTNRLSVILIYLLLLALIATYWWPPSLAITLLLAITLIVINRRVYQFFLTQKGSLFTLKVIPWHFLYFFYSGLAFAIGLIRHRLTPSP